MAVGADGSLQLDGSRHTPVLKREVWKLLFGVWEGAAGIQEELMKSWRLPVFHFVLVFQSLAVFLRAEKVAGGWA